MNAQSRSPWARWSQDRLFWIVVGIFVVAYFVLRRGSLAVTLIMLAALLVAITIHECAHAWVADRLGDPTARLLGRVTLNPLAHLDPLGTIMMIMTVIAGFGMGWGKPVPVSPWRLKYGSRLGNGLVALAGPCSNLALALVLGLASRLVPPAQGVVGWLFVALDMLVLTNLAIAFFNLLPLPPLDGASVLIGLLSLSRGRWAWQATRFLDSLARYGPMLLIGLILISQVLGVNILGTLVGAPAFGLYRLITGRV